MREPPGNAPPMATPMGPSAWFVTLPSSIPSDELARCLALLDGDERARAAAFKVEPARQQFVVGHAVMRTLLSRVVTAIAPEKWRFGRGEHGKPFVEGSTLSVNLSHTCGAVAAAVSHDGPIGIDVELPGRRPIDLQHFRAYLPQDEFAELISLSDHHRQQRFYEIWVGKEAVAKAVGTGISSAMADVRTAIPGGHLYSRSADARYAGWRVTRAELPTGHFTAIATRSAGVIDARQCTFDAWLSSLTT